MIKINIPGAAQFSASTLDRLAAQLAQTLAQVSQIEGIEITDGHAGPDPVRPERHPSSSRTCPAGSVYRSPVPPDLYYVHAGGVYDTLGQHLRGKVGIGSYD